MKPRKTIEFNNTVKEIKPLNFLFLTLAGIINAFGVTLFLFPVRLYDSGISGVSMLFDQITPSSLTLPLFLFVLNVPIFIFGYRKQKLAFTVYSIYTIAVYSCMSYLIMNVLPIDVSIISPLAGSDLLLCAIFGGVISGVGSGLTIRFGGAIDGVDVLSVIFAKKIGISIGTFVMIFNTILYSICGIVIDSWILPLYSIVTYFVGAKTIDYIVEGFNRSKCAMIVTTKATEITEVISNQFGASGTIVNAIGGFSKEEKKIIYFIINHFQINKLKQIVHDIDKNAFISLQDVSDIIKNQKNGEKEVLKMKTIVAYFSASGVTKGVAEKLAEKIGADTYEIKPVKPYTNADLNWMNKNSRSTLEMKDKSSRPEIITGDIDVSKYDRILLGYPVWWYTAPTIINSFLEAYDFSGKEIIIWATSGGSGLGKAKDDLAKSTTATITNGKILNTPAQLEQFVKEIIR